MRPWSLLIPAVVAAACASLAPARSDELFAAIDRGMSEEEVLRVAGPPDNTMSFPLSKHKSWGYFYFDTWGYYIEFSVTFKDGRAVSKLSRRVNDGGDLGT
jgi:hypothetical protein